ncbi:ATP-binding protein [Pseudomonas monteilii]|uniref:ATP-binding protein n=1 Tax=Pseudomonas monteilii TaxID=76759 RepID=UPI0015F8D035|nr:ATP-binding protein [Pseudomonas monteilii]MBA6105257.1 ATP-binding protein [Pseudomonas monteilii]
MILPFELDPQIIHHIIYSQAGSVGKAIIELVMNSVDAGAKSVRLTMTRSRFNCSDDGSGFASRDDVLRYFGRFGTPHQEGDASYGRFRLGRGQIMAHACTVWSSNSWQMTVDTRSMGYHYDLAELAATVPGCMIEGSWYEPLNDLELMSALQEIRDLVRYTTIAVELNGKVITRDPNTEKWDFEDEWAYYRAKEEGPVSIYNQGVLVRNDSSHVWGAGGVIVTKKAIDLNVSRTEILRKTCKVWKPIAKQFNALAEQLSKRQGAHRKTAARREKSARALLSGDPNITHIAHWEEVITLLPGKRHITLMDFLRKAQREHKGKITIIEHGKDIPKGEAIAQDGIIQVVHPQTLDRFGCNTPEDFEDVLGRAITNVTAAMQSANPHHGADTARQFFPRPTLVAFATLREAFIERTQVVSEKVALDKETRRAWIALRWCIQQYVGVCLGARRYMNGRLAYDEQRLQVLLGDSNIAEAWTDGESFLAISVQIVKRLSAEPLKTAAYIFGLVEHEIAHQGDSLECGHDEAFYQRYHDISIRMAPERQRYMHMWLMKYTTSMETEGKKAGGNAWRERYLVDRVGSGRVKRGLPPAIEDVSLHPLVRAEVPAENTALINLVNTGLVKRGVCPRPPDWESVLRQAACDQVELTRRNRELAAAIQRENDEWWEQEVAAQRGTIAPILEIDPMSICERALVYLYDMWLSGSSDDALRTAWQQQDWTVSVEEHCYHDVHDDQMTPEQEEALEQLWLESEQEALRNPPDPRPSLDEDCRELVQEGETLWSLERNAAVAGFWSVEAYLRWRATEAA